jgi:predicted NBD/HSP70 family sugar kinase
VSQSYRLFTLGTGIGGGIAIDGKLRLGRFGAAGELGHQTIVPNGPPCGCGSRGCLETLASGTALVVGEAVKERVGMFSPDDVRIEASQLGDQAGTWGGLALAADPSIVSPR